MVNAITGQAEHTAFAGLSNRNQSNPTARLHAQQRRGKLIRQLRRAGRRNKRARRLADKLGRCSPIRPCWSGACPVCGLAVTPSLDRTNAPSSSETTDRTVR